MARTKILLGGAIGDRCRCCADLAIVYGFGAGIIGDGALIYTLSLSPLSAFRGLVLETAVAVAAGTGPRTASPVASVVGLALWTAASLAIASVAVGRTD